jgi:GT2 family glycosyltransferase
MNHIFILSYCGASEFFEFAASQPFSNSKFYFIDNGAQTYNTSIDCLTYTTTKNLGCAGGWNLIALIAFKSLNLDKIIITQDDARYTEAQIEQALEETSESCLTGVYQPHFEFSCFAIHKNTYEKVGSFDENFLYVYSEDADYKQRCLLNKVTVSSLYFDSKKSNDSLTLKKKPELNRIAHNRAYLAYKWGPSIHPSPSSRADAQPPFQFLTPFASEGNFPLDYAPIKENQVLPSAQEYAIFKESNSWKV